jgi:alkylation response protein AidB-like acyl-CoA dehydrogenase
MKNAGLDKESLQMLLDTIGSFGKQKLPAKVRLELDEKDEFPLGLIQELLGPEIGLHLLFIPEELGGLGGSAYDVYRVSEDMARLDLGVATAFLAIFLGTDPIVVGSTEEQRNHWLRRIGDEGLIVAYAVTEPLAGSELSAIRTKADRVIENGELKGYKINGTKQFISNGGFAQLYSVLAATPDGPTFFLVEKGTPGLIPGKHENKHGIRSSNTSPVTFEDVFVPKENLLGGVEGKGLIHAQSVFGFTRLMVAAFGLGGGVQAMLKAIRYSRERVQAGTTLSEKQGYMDKLIVPHVVKLEAARAYIEEVARRLDAGEPELQTEGAIAKLFATEEGNASADAAVQAWVATATPRSTRSRRFVATCASRRSTKARARSCSGRCRATAGAFTCKSAAVSTAAWPNRSKTCTARIPGWRRRGGPGGSRRARNHRALPRGAPHAPPARAFPTWRADDPRGNRGQFRPLRGRSRRREVRAVLRAQGGQGHVEDLRARSRARRAGRRGSPGARHGRRGRRGMADFERSLQTQLSTPRPRG